MIHATRSKLKIYDNLKIVLFNNYTPTKKHLYFSYQLKRNIQIHNFENIYLYIRGLNRKYFPLTKIIHTQKVR